MRNNPFARIKNSNNLRDGDMLKINFSFLQSHIELTNT